jgi:hypothetical protein
MYHDQTTRPLQDIRWELFTLLAHGAFVTIVDKTGYDGWLDPVAYQRIGAAFADVREHREHFGQSPLREVGIYFSARTRDWYGRENPARYYAAFQGLHKACVLEHIPYSILLDENLTLAGLQQFPVVCLPHATVVCDREVKTFREYVEKGGHLIVTGHSGLYDRHGAPQERSSLAELIGARFVRRLDSLDNWVRFPARAAAPAPDRPTASSERGADAIFNGIPQDWPFLVEGPAAVYEPTTATTAGELLQPFRAPNRPDGFGPDWPLSAESAVGPAALIHPLGAGCVVTFACSPDTATASEHHIVEVRRLLRNTVRWLHPQPAVDVQAPANVEAVVTDDAGQRRLRVHLLAYNPTPQTTPPRNRPYVMPGLIEDPPLYRASVRIDRPVRSATTLRPTTEVQHQEGRVNLLVNDVHETLILDY